jgi:hypothetical protein
MKKVFLLSLSLALGFSAFAQQRVAKNDSQSFKVDSKKVVVGNETINPSVSNFASPAAQSVVVNRYDNIEDGTTMYTTYDLQSNSWCSNRMYQLPDGSVGVVGTMSHQENQTASDRGTGYNFYDGNDWLDMPDERVENVRTGWPTIAQWGETGEIMISHSPCRCWTREVAGQGEWQYMGELPYAPEDYPYPGENISWPRVATSGPNHNIIHVIGDIQHSVSDDEVHHHQAYLRSEDAVNWTITYSPLAQDGEEADHYSADAYNIASNGHNVAIIYSDDLQSHVVMYKSTDDGETWKRTVIWENPYYGCDWETDPCSVFTDTMFGPSNVAIAIDNKGVAHVAMNTYEYIHDEIGNTYTTYRGRTVDGIYYWNDTQEAPIQSEDGNPHHALRLWWPIPGDPEHVEMHADSTKWIGYLPMYEDGNGNLISYENDKFYIGDDYFYKFRAGQSGMPALSIDPMGNIACAYSCPCTRRENSDLGKYYRSIYVSYLNVDEGYWHPYVDDLTDDFMYDYSENIFTISVNNTVNPGEFWIGFQMDDVQGLYWGSNASQSTATTNEIHAFKIIADPELVSVPENHDAVNPMTSTRVYPNPTTDVLNIEVNACQNSAMNISVYNIMGQKVMENNVNITTGMNCPSISTSSLSSGIYFVTVKANGFENTMKFIVK